MEDCFKYNLHSGQNDKKRYLCNFCKGKLDWPNRFCKYCIKDFEKEFINNNKEEFNKLLKTKDNV